MLFPAVVLLIISCVVIYVAASLTRGTGLKKFFRIGPISLIPPMLIWAVVSYLSCHRGECPDLWRTLPLYAAVAFAALWHFALVAFEKERKFYLWYAVIHFPTIYYLCFAALVVATKFPL